jgi:hypothetical protein
MHGKTDVKLTIHKKLPVISLKQHAPLLAEGAGQDRPS